MSGYFDIETIMSEEQLVPTVFLSEAAGLGILDSSSASANLEVNSRVDMPLWLAQDLATRGVSIGLFQYQ